MKKETEAARNPFPYSDTNRRFYTYDYYLRHTFGCKCFKVPLDGGFTCPNIDGTKGRGGCLYCGLPAAHPERGCPPEAGAVLYAHPPLREQFDLARERLHQKWKTARYIVYFQDFSNTYAPLPVLQSLYEEALTFPDVVGLNIATRADCIDEEIASYLRDLAGRTALTVELGLQSAKDETAALIRRGHTTAQFEKTVKLLAGVDICIHIINGLPGESREQMMDTARYVAALHPQSVKIHLLHVLRGTGMAALYLAGEYAPMTLDDYTNTVCDQLELLPPDIVIARITGDGMADQLLAPAWSLRKFAVMNAIDKEMVRRGSWQGIRAET